MKPISVKFRCFGPYRKEMSVDLEELSKKGLVLICGETGAGKTTILDAMCYALYGKSSGGLRGDLSVMRCKLADPKEETRVEFIFEAGNERYMFTRSLRYGRKNLIDEHNCLIWKDGVFVPLFENPKIKNVNQKAEELIGLTYEQFRQVIILPQGQFEKLLVSDSAEKEKILVSLFRAEKWQTIADEFYERVASEDKSLREELLEIRSKLRDYECETVEELFVKLEKQKDTVAEGEKETEEKQKEVALEKEVYEAMLQKKEQFDFLFAAENERKNLEEQIPFMDSLQKALEKADLAEELRIVFEKQKEANEKVIAKIRQEMDEEKRLEKVSQMLKKVEEKQEALEKTRPQYEASVKRVFQLEQSKEAYRIIEEKQKEAGNNLKILKEKKLNYDLRKKNYDLKHGEWLKSLQSQKETMEAYTQAQNVYMAGISGMLAMNLVDGEACPVCGSTSHPLPAEKPQEVVTKQQLDEMNQRMMDANKKVEQAAQVRQEEEAKCEQAQNEMETANQKYTAAQASYEEASQQKIEGISTIEELETKQKELQDKNKKYEEMQVTLQKSINECKANEQTVIGILGRIGEEKLVLEDERVKTAQVWKSRLESSQFVDEKDFLTSLMEPAKKNEKKNNLFSFKSNLESAKLREAELRTRLSGLEKPEVETKKQKVEQLESLLKEAEKTLILGRQSLQRMEKDYASLLIRKNAHNERRIVVDENLEFANRLRGRSGVSLQRYVLGVMLTSITSEANRLLKNVHNGRYQLYRTDAISGSGRKGGLELEVLDTQNNERRSVTTLSGGEKFLVALSLAIGLSTTVQAQGKGIHLGAMFIDEGFGSLDQDSIYDALEVLQGIQKACGLVGIISHVELLKEVIPEKIEVHKTKEGSWF